ncbi:hypothetical protein C2E21_1451 [Chlorella sorokiniana]|jgi:hypothetical protein|uniref:Uncharacterized protein n=1 Tax=Chlorella sorokiniana TaxID=3076 RepID=A0A2P6U0L4_CHLSO|nr:hypothetical protein C2E21_1451 [Chlorella sorokiniana]|eukprot:PRW59857.1 hypothetical protein C2E21_1451 [Chlorella sorokiniana]
MSSSKSGFKAKLDNFQQRFKSLLGARAQGYDELNTLERPLVSDVHEQEEYERAHGVPAAGAGTYAPPGATSGYAAPGYTPAAAYGAQPARTGAGLPAPPSQADELQELSVLAKDAAEILWEMVAMGEGGAAVEDMKSKAGQLQAQLRGLISDYQGGDEAIFAKAFEAFDMLSRCLEEQNAPQQQELPPAAAAVAGTGAPAGLAPPPAAVAAPVAARPPADEPPLISFD